jgi:hypothetical protein
MSRKNRARGILVGGLFVVSVFHLTGRNAKADYVFGPAVNSGPVINTETLEIEPIPEPLLFWFARRTASEEWEWWRAQRAAEDLPWEDPVNLGLWEESHWNLLTIAPSSTTADGLELYYSADEARRPEGYGGTDIWTKKRPHIDDDWGPAVNLGPTVNTAYDEELPAISPDGLELYFSGWSRDNARPGGYGRADLWVTRRATRNEPWGEPVNLGPTVNSPAFDARPHLLGNGLLLFFESDRPGGSGDVDLYMMRRATISDPWTEPMNLGPRVNGPNSDESGFLSPDGSTLYFHCDRPGGYGTYDIWQVPVIPIVDFNGNSTVDIHDLQKLIEAWGLNEPSLDMGPTPFGDGVVDEADLEVLMRYWGQAVYDPHLLAHWALDETEGMVAADSVGYSNGMVFGDPLWQPEAGQVGGALEFDGIDDAVIIKPVLDPEDGPFSVFAWIKGGQAGQVIMSQQKGADWLMLDADGMLMMDPRSAGRKSISLYSEAIIADGQWHRIGLVWDGYQPTLYVDDVPVAMDPQIKLGSSTGGLAIGVGRDNETETFWSGMIDEVRIYDRVVKP